MKEQKIMVIYSVDFCLLREENNKGSFVFEGFAPQLWHCRFNGTYHVGYLNAVFSTGGMNRRISRH